LFSTLRPVITLKYDSGDGSGSATVAQGDLSPTDSETSDLSLSDTASDKQYPSVTGAYVSKGNFDDSYGGNHEAAHSLMAEESTSSVNGWVIGAIASAVAGLALLGYSTRRTAVATSVPV
jgi:predicted HicB family RNase H-like nuclease